jgi:hypothetical protein
MRPRLNKKARKRIDEEALQTLRDPRFLYNASQKVAELGVVGEKRNRLTMILACITRHTPDPVSIILQAPPGSGKTTLMRSAVRLFPPDYVTERAGLSKKALAFGKRSLKNTVLVINEYKCGKDAQLFIRLTQSGEDIAHEYTTISGRRRQTEVVKRTGTPVVLTTTTDERIFPDDASRFLALHVDSSPKQNRAIVLARAKKPRIVNLGDLPVWQAAMAKLKCKADDFQHPPRFLADVAKRLPLNDVSVRRQWNRILSFLSAAALVRGFESKQPVDIEFADYCVVYRILEPILVSALQRPNTPESQVARATAALNKRLGRSVTVRELAKKLNWKEPRVYKHVTTAARQKLVKYESGSRERNLRPIIARKETSRRFLPSPRSVLRRNREIGKKVKYVDPFTGKRKKVER